MAAVEEITIKPVAARPRPIRSAKKLNILGQRVYLKILRASRFKKPWTLMGLLPWDRDVEHLAGLRPAQTRVVADFQAVASSNATKGIALADRLALIQAALKGRKFGGKARVVHAKLSPDELRDRTARVRALVTHATG